MSATPDPGPFQPGAGGLPPYVAGREVEQSQFRELFGTLRRGIPVCSEVLVYGPSGNGKSTLLRWAGKQARREGLDFCRVDSNEIRTPAELVSRLRLGTWLPDFAPDGLSADEADGQRPGLPPLAEALEARAKHSPWVVVVDEAQSLDRTVGRWLLNAAPVAGREAPFLSVLAGAANLRARLSEMGASFWSRAEPLPIGRLDSTATAEAIRRPLADEGIGIDEEALVRIVRESHGYPYFVQCWGRVIWDRLRGLPESERRVTLSVVESAAADFESGKRCYFEETATGLETDGVLPAAREVAAAFRERTRLGHFEFRNAVARGVRDPGGPSPKEAADALEREGFVWQAEGKPIWEPGIPGLMDYILDSGSEPGGDAATR